jgi:biopolymer transport protein ExbB
MSFLERGLVWLSLFIAIAPLLGFLGTVVGMIQAFDAIEEAGDISPSLVAGQCCLNERKRGVQSFAG